VLVEKTSPTPGDNLLNDGRSEAGGVNATMHLDGGLKKRVRGQSASKND